MRSIKASELGSFLYCKRAWWYQQQGEPSENTQTLDAGSASHATHARVVKSATILKWLAIILLGVGLALILLECLS